MKELLETLARELVLEPEHVEVAERVEAGRLRLSLRVARADRGRVIGRDGRTAEALETLLDALLRSRGLVCRVEVLD